MHADSTTQAVLFPPLGERPVIARFDEPHGSSDGGVILLKAVDQRLGLTARLAACLPDAREPDKVVHPLVDLVRQRVFGLACGYADANDAARLADDPVHKLLLSIATRSTARPWPPSPRCRALRTRSAAQT